MTDPEIIYNPVTIAECGGPCEHGPQHCDCGELRIDFPLTNHSNPTMTEQQHPITPPSELLEQWRKEAPRLRDCGVARENWIATQAAQWGADQKPDACVEWVPTTAMTDLELKLKEAMDSLIAAEEAAKAVNSAAVCSRQRQMMQQLFLVQTVVSQEEQ